MSISLYPSFEVVLELSTKERLTEAIKSLLLYIPIFLRSY